jgi:hypothetical protein
VDKGCDKPALRCPHHTSRFYWQCKDIKTLQGNAAELAKQPEKQGQQLGAPGLPQEAQGKQTQVQTAGGAEVVKPWGQCGGITNNPAGTDIVWPNVTCPPVSMGEGVNVWGGGSPGVKDGVGKPTHAMPHLCRA